MTNRNTKVVLTLLAVLMAVGLWHAWPLTSVVFDENYFAGGVLRALQAHSIFPQGIDVPYGTLTFYGSYLLMLPMLILILPFTNFSILGLIQILNTHTWLAYLPVRLLSLVAFIVLLVITERFWRKLMNEESGRLALLILTFTTFLPLVMVHTGKVWTISTVLLLCSFMALSRSRGADWFALVSIVTSFLAFSNFPIMGIALINLPILLWQNRASRASLKRLGMFVLVGATFFVVIVLTNSAGIRMQVLSIFQVYTFSPEAQAINLPFLSSLSLNIYKVLRFFPLLLVAMLLAVRLKLHDKRLAYLSLVYTGVYILVISVVARWSTSLDSLVRYLLPVPFLLSHFISSFDWRNSRALKVLAVISLVGGVYMAGIIARPTTYNQASVWVISNLAREDTFILNKASPELALPMNEKSYSFTRPEFCASLCQAVRSAALTPDFKPVVITEQSVASSSTLRPGYVIMNEKEETLGQPYFVFTSGVPDGEELILDTVADYFSPAFWRIHRLGRNIYVYKTDK